MYKLTKLDKFYISNLVWLRWNWLTKNELWEWINELLLMDNEALGYFINKMLHSWENDWSYSKTSTEQNLFDNCSDLVKKLINWTEEAENNDEIIDSTNELSNIHPDIYSHIDKLFNDRHYDNAVEESYKITRLKLVEITWNEKAHEAFKDGFYEVFFWKKPETEVEKNFFDWIKFLHLAIQNFRNEKAHTPAWELEKGRAIHYIYLASLAYDLIDIKKN